MSKNLVIVESPAKAKTIEKYLGKDYTVVASFGHIRDLPKTGMSIDIEHGFAPNYVVSPDKAKTVAGLRKLAKAADTVWLASDEDREGEAIAWHVANVLGLDPKKTKRIVFHEITEPAIKAAIASPRFIDQHLVDAQQARRVLDRLVGYELSPVLWKKVRTGLSAGRVQSVAVRIIVDREREIEGFSTQATYRLAAEFTTGNGSVVRAERPAKFKTKAEAQAFLEVAEKSTFSIKSLETKPGKKSPSAPFTTSTLQQEASRKLGYSVRQTMTIAQKLYEQGLITYMRTDSLNLSELAIKSASSEISKDFGANYVHTRKFHTKSAGAQEAHEAIRPTEFGRRAAGADSGQKRLYELIWKRTIASQMADAVLEKTEAIISFAPSHDTLVAKGEIIKFDGFLAVYLEGADDEEMEEQGLLPKLTIGEALGLGWMRATQSYDRAKPRYTEASLVKRMEEMGIGRPSTYAPTISTIQDRGYVEKTDKEGTPRDIQIVELTGQGIVERIQTEMTGAERSKLFPTPIGELVTDFLVKHFPSIVDFQFTAKVEQDFDEIEEGKTSWNIMISEFYTPFHKTVESAADISREEASGARELGKDPKSGKPVIARMGRYGLMLQIGEAEDEEKPRFAPMPVGRKVDTVTLEEALEQFKLPRDLGQTPAGESISANIGRFGPYVKVGKLFVSIKPEDPFSITLEKAQELIAAKKAADAAKTIREFEGSDIKVLNGRFGPYVTNGKTNAKIPKGQDPATLDLPACEALIAAAPDKPRGRFTRKPKA